MHSFSRQSQTPPNFNTKTVVAIIIVVSLALSVFYLVATSLPNISSEPPQESKNYTVLTFALYQSVNYTQGGIAYEFRYVSGVTLLNNLFSKRGSAIE